MKDNTKIREPQQSRSITTKEKIINAGMELFSEKGFYHTNSKEIAKYAQIGVGSFYDYFKDKKDLLLTILVRHSSEFTDNLELLQNKFVLESDKKLSYEEKKSILTVLIDFVIDFHESAPDFHAQIPKLRHLDADIENIIDKWDKSQRTVILNIITVPQLNIQLDDFETTSLIIHRTVEDISHCIMECNDSIKKLSLRNELINMIGKYIFT